eukprot:NODE_2979_length_432_cov_536.796345_g2475_i0.p1 GENE.NODE_2979_length_432_cov_536.796345_g2475_i0~~NODE_2979_length_432_cov_536.796345_g2475_i0.p1  ORF type:complete len:71 (-),score=9.73 NODE_2979_length_432_cov_536.796345_g2475_i0:83-295(-)
MLYGLLDPTLRLQEAETQGKLATRLALMEEMKSMPFGAVWDKLCAQAGVPVGVEWISVMEQYEETVLKAR